MYCRAMVQAVVQAQSGLDHLHAFCTAFPAGLSLYLVFGSFFYLHPFPPFIFTLINHCDRCLVLLAWELNGFTSHRHNSVKGLALPKVEAPDYLLYQTIIYETVTMGKEHPLSYIRFSTKIRYL